MRRALVGAGLVGLVLLRVVTAGEVVPGTSCSVTKPIHAMPPRDPHERDESRDLSRSIAQLPIADVQIENPGVVDELVERALS